MTQMLMSDLFHVQKAAISKHLKNIFNQVSSIKNQLFTFWKQFKMRVAEQSKEIGASKVGSAAPFISFIPEASRAVYVTINLKTG